MKFQMETAQADLTNGDEAIKFEMLACYCSDGSVHGNIYLTYGK
jgi:hypothetical protein